MRITFFLFFVDLNAAEAAYKDIGGTSSFAWMNSVPVTKDSISKQPFVICTVFSFYLIEQIRSII